METDGGPLNIAVSRKTDKQQTMSLDISRQLQALFQNSRRDNHRKYWPHLHYVWMKMNSTEFERKTVNETMAMKNA